MNPEYTEPSLEGIDVDLEHMGDGMGARIRGQLDFLRVLAFTLEENRRIALHGIGHQPLEDLQQLIDAGASLGRDEAHRYQVLVPQCFFEWIV